MAESIIPSTNLEEDLDRYLRMGYRMDMIMPVDAPTVAVVSRPGESIRLVMSSSFSGPDDDHEPTKVGTQNGWVTGRAGMEYRDLIPGRADGRIVASHIRLAEDGPVPDYVHCHKIEFQMIYCLRGRIRVVYEDQGPPFWLETGDCVLQPPEIRHRVLESVGQAEVVEVSMPAVHETWVEHDIELPTADVNPERDFSGQRFCRYIAADAEWRSDVGGCEYSDTGIGNATNELAKVRCIRFRNGGMVTSDRAEDRKTAFYFAFVVSGEVIVSSRDSEDKRIGENDSVFFPRDTHWSIAVGKDTQCLEVSINR